MVKVCSTTGATTYISNKELQFIVCANHSKIFITHLHIPGCLSGGKSFQCYPYVKNRF